LAQEADANLGGAQKPHLSRLRAHEKDIPKNWMILGKLHTGGS
jgi:hypothetical protein